MQEIEKLRAEIDQIHADLAGLFRKRLQLCEKIWKIKRDQKIALYDSAREEVIIHRFDSTLTDESERKTMQNIFRAVLAESKKYLELKSK